MVRFFWVITLFFTAWVFAQEKGLQDLPVFDWKLEAPEETLSIGDTVQAKLDGVTPPFQLEVPEGSDPLMELGWRVQVNEGGLIFLTPLKDGQLSLPPLYVKKEERVGRTKNFSLSVKKIPESQNVPQVLDPVGLPFPIWVIWTVLLVAVLVVVGVVMLLKRYSSQRRLVSEPVKVDEPQKPEHIVAMEELQKIERSSYLQDRQYKKYCFAISETMKRYIGARYGFYAMESTSEELLRELRARLHQEGLNKELEQLFRSLDMIKFTDQVPQSEESPKLLKEAIQFVGKTKRVSGGSSEV